MSSHVRPLLLGAVGGCLLTLAASWLRDMYRKWQRPLQQQVEPQRERPETPEPPEADPDQLLDFLLASGQLKQLPRTGWVDRGIPNPETVAAHSWRMAVLALLLAPSENLEAETAARIALFHDLPEALVGDITPEEFSGVRKADKSEMELRALLEITSHLGEHQEKYAGETRRVVWCCCSPGLNLSQVEHFGTTKSTISMRARNLASFSAPHLRIRMTA